MGEPGSLARRGLFTFKSRRFESNVRRAGRLDAGNENKARFKRRGRREANATDKGKRKWERARARNNRDAQEETIYKSQTKGNKWTSLSVGKGYTGNNRKRGIRERGKHDKSKQEAPSAEKCMYEMWSGREEGMNKERSVTRISPCEVSSVGARARPGRAHPGAATKVLQLGIDRAAVQFDPSPSRVVVPARRAVSGGSGGGGRRRRCRRAFPTGASRQGRAEPERNATFRTARGTQRGLQARTRTPEVILGRAECSRRHGRGRTRWRRPERVKVGRRERVHGRQETRARHSPRALVRVGKRRQLVLDRRHGRASTAANRRDLQGNKDRTGQWLMGGDRHDASENVNAPDSRGEQVQSARACRTRAGYRYAGASEQAPRPSQKSQRPWPAKEATRSRRPS